MLSYAAYAVFDETRDLYEINLRQFPEVSGLCYQPEDIELEAQECRKFLILLSNKKY